MAKREPDADEQPIHFSKSYRRAKRNVLFWAAATIPTALGTASSASGVVVESMVKGLEFPPGLLTVFSLGVLVFMFAGYTRTEARLLAQHTGFAYARHLKEVANEADALAREIDHFRSGVVELDREVGSRRGEIANAMTQALLTLGGDVDHLPKDITRDFRDFRMDPSRRLSDEEILSYGRDVVQRAAATVNLLLKERVDFLMQRHREATQTIETAFGNIEAWKTHATTRDLEIRNEISKAAT